MPHRVDNGQLLLIPTDPRDLSESIGLDWWAAKKLHDDKWLSFNPETTISYQLPMDSFVELTIYSLTGQKISTLLSVQQQAGIHRFEWDASDLASGVYIYQLQAGNFMASRKLLMLK